MAWPLGHAWSPSDHPKVKSKQTSKRHPQAALLAEGRTDPGLQWAPEPGPFQGSPAFLLSLSGSLPLAIKKVPRLSISGKSLETHGRHYVPVISWETHQSVPHSSGGDNYTLPSQIYVPILFQAQAKTPGQAKSPVSTPTSDRSALSQWAAGVSPIPTRPLCFQPPAPRVPRPQTPTAAPGGRPHQPSELREPGWESRLQLSEDRQVSPPPPTHQPPGCFLQTAIRRPPR